MKKIIYSILFLSLIGLIVLSCEKENDTSNSSQLILSGQLINEPTCKNELKKVSDVINTSDTLSCIEYIFDSTNNKLTLKHINAAFNCCPDSLFVKTSINGDTIIIQEYEANAACYCNCLYDLHIELTGVEIKNYQIKFIEPYAIDQQEILFEADLVNNNEGEYCVTRKQYPWGEIDGSQLVFTGELVDNSTCKSDYKSALDAANTSDTLSCIEYIFDIANNKLTLKHINACFNCCPGSLYVQTLLDDNTIIIQEFETGAYCSCLCLFDLDIELNGVKNKKYQIKFIEPYAKDQQEIEFEVDLVNNSEGLFCVTRERYPWGN